MNHSSTKQSDYDQALNLFRNGDYRSAYGRFLEFLEKTDSVTEEMRARKNICDCIVDGWPPEEWVSLAEPFDSNLERYLALLKGVSKKDIAPVPTVDFFSKSIRFLATTTDATKLGTKLCDLLFRFVETSEGKVAEKDFRTAFLREAESTRRRAFETGGDSSIPIAMFKALLDVLGDDCERANERAYICGLLADLYYFMPSRMLLPERTRIVLGFLDRALRERPDDPFAKNFKETVQKYSQTLLQIRRFNHDTNSRMGNIHAIMNAIESRCAESDPETKRHVATLRREIGSIDVIGRIIKSEQPGANDWSDIRISTIVHSLLDERKWPEKCFDPTGCDPETTLCPALTSLALDNLMRNTIEACSRNAIPIGPLPCRIVWQIPGQSLLYQDWAGGIPPDLGDVFEPYVSSKGVYDNVGLGLGQAREAMRLQGGDLRLDVAQPERGTKFILSFT